MHMKSSTLCHCCSHFSQLQLLCWLDKK